MLRPPQGLLKVMRGGTYSNTFRHPGSN